MCGCACQPGGVEDRVGGLTRAEGEAMTPGVVTEWYRAPEVVLIPHAAKVAYYSTAIDTWSFGCIFYELLGSQPMAQGRGAAEVCSCWLSVIGSPSSGVGSPLYLQGEHAQALLIEALRIPVRRPPLPCHGVWPLVQRALQWDCRLRPSMADLATTISALGFALQPVARAAAATESALAAVTSVDGLLFAAKVEPPASEHGISPVKRESAASEEGRSPSPVSSGGGFPPGAASVDGSPPVAGAAAEGQSSKAGPVPEVGPAFQCTGTCGSLTCKREQNLRSRGQPWTRCAIPPCEDLVCVGGASVRPNTVAASAGRLVRAPAVLGGGASIAGPQTQNKLCRGTRS